TPPSRLRAITTPITARVRSATSWMDSMSGSARRRSAREPETLGAMADREWPCRHRTPPIRHHWARLRDESGAEVAERLGEPSGDRTRDPLIKSQVLYRSELTARAVILQGYRPGATSGRAVMPVVMPEPANGSPAGRRRSRLRVAAVHALSLVTGDLHRDGPRHTRA